jgi:hypothetical protein
MSLRAREIVAIIAVLTLPSSFTHASYEAMTRYRAEVVSVQEQVPGPKEKYSHHFKMTVKVVSFTKGLFGTQGCRFHYGKELDIEVFPLGRTDLPRLEPGSVIDLECHYQNYRSTDSAAEGVFWLFGGVSADVRR